MIVQLKKWWPFALIATSGGGFLLVVVILLLLNSGLPPVERLENPDYSLPTIIYDRHGTRVQEVFIKRRKLVGFDQLPRHLVNALIAKEDSRFFEHRGIDPLRMLKAAWVNLIAMGKKQGASTLTQQTARQFFLTLERTWSRKIKEILLSLKIEREFTKQEILTLYLNKVNFGDAWGVAAAANVYFDKKVENLSLSESATLVGLLPAPNRYKPTRNLNLSRQQRNIVLLRMAEEGFITQTQQLATASEPIVLSEHKDPTLAAVAYYVELVRRILLEKYGTKNLYEGGLHVYTAMDLNAQVAAHVALTKGVRALDRRHGYRGALDTVKLDAFGQVPEEVLDNLNPPQSVRVGRPSNGVVLVIEGEVARVALGLSQEGVIPWDLLKEQWLQKIDPAKEDVVYPITSLQSVLAPGDMIQVLPTWRDPDTGAFSLDLFQEPQANGGVYAMDPNSGDVVAMVGGVRFGRMEGASEFIRATQATRQPGSSFKPIVYATAIDEGYTPATILDDTPRTFTLGTGKKHIPKNYDGKYLGRITLREALARSRNVPTVQLVQEMGARKVIDYAKRLGITTDIPDESIIALGTHSVKLDELTRAYGVFAANGKLVEPVYIRRIEDSKGKVLESAHSVGTQVISSETAYLVTDILQDVVRKPYGTGYRALKGFDRPAAGKTGTTQNYTDAWFIGFIPQLVAGVYVGYDDPQKSLGPAEGGGRAAAPIWRDFMDTAKSTLPIATFEQPPTVVAHRVNINGTLLGPCDQAADSRLELFKTASIPERLRSSARCGSAALPVFQRPSTTREDDNL